MCLPCISTTAVQVPILANDLLPLTPDLHGPAAKTHVAHYAILPMLITKHAMLVIQTSGICTGSGETVVEVALGFYLYFISICCRLCSCLAVSLRGSCAGIMREALQYCF